MRIQSKGRSRRLVKGSEDERTKYHYFMSCPVSNIGRIRIERLLLTACGQNFYHLLMRFASGDWVELVGWQLITFFLIFTWVSF